MTVELGVWRMRWRLGARRFVMALASVAILSVLGGVVPAGAYDGPGCARTWNQAGTPHQGATGSIACTFVTGGIPVDISGTATAAAGSGGAELRVWLSPAGSPEVVLKECTASGPTSASCGGQFSAIVLDVQLPSVPGGTGVTLQCNMTWRGNRAGDAGCFGPRNCPTIGDLACIKVLGSPLPNP